MEPEVASARDEVLRRMADLSGLPVEALSVETELAEFGLDSMQTTALIVALEDAFGVAIPERVVYDWVTIADVVDDLARRKAAG